MLLTWPSCGDLIIKCSLASMHAGLASCEFYPSDKSTSELKIGTTASTKSLNRILKELDQNNSNRPIISQLRIKSIRNKLIFLALHIKDSLDNLYHLRQNLKIYFPQHSFYWIVFQDLRYSYWNRGTVPRTGITSKKISGGWLLKMLKYLEVMLNIFEFPYVKEIVESWLGYVNKFL